MVIVKENVAHVGTKAPEGTTKKNSMMIGLTVHINLGTEIIVMTDMSSRIGIHRSVKVKAKQVSVDQHSVTIVDMINFSRRNSQTLSQNQKFVPETIVLKVKLDVSCRPKNTEVGAGLPLIVTDARRKHSDHKHRPLQPRRRREH